jgi:hypothetical protein
VKEDVSEKLPDKSLLPDENGNQTQIDAEMSIHHVHHHLQKEDPHHDEHQFLDDRGQTIPKRESGAIIGHGKVLSDLPGRRGRIQSLNAMSYTFCAVLL